MIDFLSSWIEQIVIAVLICSIFELILPNGNINKYIKMIMGVYIVFSIISPFVDSNAIYNLNSEKFIKKTEENNIKTNSNINQESMDKRLKELYIKELKNNIKQKIEDKGYNIQKVDVDADLDSSSTNPGIHKIDIQIKNEKSIVKEIEKVNISVGSNVEEKYTIEENSQDVQELKKSLAEYYEIDQSIITIEIVK